MINWETIIRHIAQSLKELKVWFFQGPCTINNPSMIRRWQWKVGIEKSGATIEMIQTNEECLPRAAVVDPSTGKLKRKLKMELIFVINVPAEYAANQLMVKMMRKIITTIIIVTIIIMKISFRWKERFFILTKDYFHCFKKDSSKLTEMGEFLFKVNTNKLPESESDCKILKNWKKVKLVDIDGVSLLDKRGYLTICVSQVMNTIITRTRISISSVEIHSITSIIIFTLISFVNYLHIWIYPIRIIMMLNCHDIQSSS